MKVKALIGFVSTFDGVKYRASRGGVLDMPKGADWLKAGLVKEIETKPKRKQKTKKSE